MRRQRTKKNQKKCAGNPRRCAEEKKSYNLVGGDRGEEDEVNPSIAGGKNGGACRYITLCSRREEE